MTKKKKIIIAGAAVVAVVIAITAVTLPNKSSAIGTVKTEELAPRTLSNTISTTGVVESTEAENVYSKLTNVVKIVNVSEGDKVQAGDVLCQLDTEDLEFDIAKLKATIDSANQSAQLSIQTNQNTYDIAKANLESGLNSQIVGTDSSVATTKAALDSAFTSYQNAKYNLENDLNSQILGAQASVDAAKSSLETAEKDYNDAKSDLENGKNSSIISAKKAFNSAGYNLVSARNALQNSNTTANELALDEAQDAYNKAAKDLDTAQSSAERELEDLKASFENKQESYDNALSTQESTATSVNQELKNLQDSYETAKISYENAVKTKVITEKSAKETLDTYQDNIESSKISADDTANQVSLQQLQLQLKDSTITAPISGTVTAVYAKEGAAPTGLLFVIENTDNLQIATAIKEYDIDNAKVGMDATIKTDGTGDKEFSGTLKKIYPAAVKASDGTTQSDTNVEFDTEIAVNGEHEGLLIGMNARVEIILEQNENVYGVSYDAVTTDKDGKSIVYVAQKDKTGNYTAKSIPVETGLETDFYIEISGEGLSDGALIISNPENITDGAKVQVGK